MKKSKINFKLQHLWNPFFIVLFFLSGCTPRESFDNSIEIIPTITLTAGKDFDCWSAENSALSDNSAAGGILVFTNSSSPETRQTDLYHYDLLTKTSEREITFPDKLGYISIASNGRYIVYDSYGHENEYVIFDRKAKKVQKVPEILSPLLPHWSKNNQCLMFEGKEKIWAYQVSTNAVQEKNKGNNLQGVRSDKKISPDGQLTARNCSSLYRICVEDENGQALDSLAFMLPKTKEAIIPMTSIGGWSSDGHILAFSFTKAGGVMGRMQTMRLVFMDKKEVKGFKDITKEIIWGTSWAPDGKHILIMAEQFEFYNTMTEENIIIPESSGYYSYYTWLSDEYLIFSGNDRRSLYKIKFDGSEFSKLPFATNTPINWVLFYNN
jgi:Tol biopolymer transport system component